MSTTSGFSGSRSKVERDPENPEVVLTVRGIGYKAGGHPHK